jgi:CheY-like chemotaxis protein
VAEGRVLLVEDEGFLRRLMAEVLQDEGFEVVEAGSGEAAATALSGRSTFDILFSDINLSSELDGIELALMARALYPRIHLVLASAYVADSLERLGATSPTATFIAKPYDADHVAAVLKQMMAGP